jgi:hypothetical protein
MADGLSGRGRNWADAAQRCEAGSDRNLSGLSPAVRGSWAAHMWPIEIARDEVRRQLIGDGGDHQIEIRDLNKKFEVTAGQGLEYPMR